MVQEVQTWIWITNETTLETIEAIGTSSFKIIEWRQTKWWHYISECNATWDVVWSYYSPASTDWPEIKSSDFHITSQTGQKEFVMRNGWVRVPAQWTYQIDLRFGAAWTSDATVILKASGRELYRKTLTSATTESITTYIDLGKFESIELWGQFLYKGGQSSANVTFWVNPTLKITQL